MQMLWTILILVVLVFESVPATEIPVEAPESPSEVAQAEEVHELPPIATEARVEPLVASEPVNESRYLGEPLYRYLGDVERDARGMCPQDVPYNWWNEGIMPTVSLGLPGYLDPDAYFTEEGYVRRMFNVHMTHQRMGETYYPYHDREDGVRLSTDWGSRTIYAGGAVDERLTAYLRSLEQQFLAKCGQYPEHLLNW